MDILKKSASQASEIGVCIFLGPPRASEMRDIAYYVLRGLRDCELYVVVSCGAKITFWDSTPPYTCLRLTNGKVRVAT